jgi:single-strand DNA-binding protein
MYSVNRVLLSGNLGSVPELRVTAKGTPAVELRLATNYRAKEGESWVDRTDWHSIDVFGNQAEVAARYLTKGSAILVEGSLRVDTWIDKETERKRSKVRILADRVIFLGGRPRVEAPVTPSSPTLVPEAAAEPILVSEPVIMAPSEEEIPF